MYVDFINLRPQIECGLIFQRDVVQRGFVHELVESVGAYNMRS